MTRSTPGTIQASSIVIKNMAPSSHPSAGHSLKNSSGKVMCVGSRGTSPAAKEVSLINFIYLIMIFNQFLMIS